jgi:hypothetical protein
LSGINNWSIDIWASPIPDKSSFIKLMLTSLVATIERTRIWRRSEAAFVLILAGLVFIAHTSVPFADLSDF